MATHDKHASCESRLAISRRSFLVFASSAVFMSHFFPGDSMASERDFPEWSAPNDSMIWESQDAGAAEPGYRVFRGRVELPSSSRAGRLSIFADARYVLWVNGHYVGRGPCRFDPKAPEFDTHNVQPLLRTGSNVVVVLVLSSVSNGKTMKHAPGLSVRLDVECEDRSRVSHVSDATWRSSRHTRYGSPRVRWGSISDNIDGRIDQMEWVDPAFDDETWDRAVRVDGGEWGPIVGRRIPLLREETLAPLPVGVVLPVYLKAGESVVFDIGRMAQGFEIVDLQADAGVELSVEHFQRFFDGQPKESYGAVTRYTTRDGPQHFMAIDSFGCRYLTFAAANGPARIDRVAFVDRG
jgi:hypothetical protein